MCKKQRLCSLPIPGPQYYYTNKTLTKTYILQIKKKKKRKVMWTLPLFVRVYENFISKWERETSHYCRPALALFSDRPQTPPLNTRDVETTNASPQRRSSSVLDASRRRGKSVNATRPLRCLIKALAKTHVCFLRSGFRQKTNNTSITAACESDVTHGSRTPCLRALKEAINQSWHYYLQLIVL